MTPEHLSPEAAELEVIHRSIEDLLDQVVDMDADEIVTFIEGMLEDAQRARFLAEREDD